MTGGGRPYRSALRDEQARATRRRIVDAGAALFVESGYVPATVGAKAAVLKLAFDWTLAGDEEPVAIADRPEVQRMMRGEDPAELLTAWMAMNAAINRRLATLYHVLVVAADADPDAAALLATTDDQRAEGARAVVGRVADLGGLRPDLDPEQAAAIADVLIDPTHYQRLVGTWGWTFETYVGHLQRIAVSLLLA
jgi:hypothetical protein